MPHAPYTSNKTAMLPSLDAQGEPAPGQAQRAQRPRLAQRPGPG